MQGTWIGEECQGVGSGLSSRQTNRLFPPPSTHLPHLTTAHLCTHLLVHLFVHTSLYTPPCTPPCAPLCTHLLYTPPNCTSLYKTPCTPLCTVYTPPCTHVPPNCTSIYTSLLAAALSCTCNLFEACWAFFVTSIFFATINFSPALSLPSSQMTDRQAGCELGTQLGIIQKSCHQNDHVMIGLPPKIELNPKLS